MTLGKGFALIYQTCPFMRRDIRYQASHPKESSCPLTENRRGGQGGLDNSRWREGGCGIRRRMRDTRGVGRDTSPSRSRATHSGREGPRKTPSTSDTRRTYARLSEGVARPGIEPEVGECRISNKGHWRGLISERWILGLPLVRVRPLPSHS